MFPLPSRCSGQPSSKPSPHPSSEPCSKPSSEAHLRVRTPASPAVAPFPEGPTAGTSAAWTTGARDRARSRVRRPEALPCWCRSSSATTRALLPGRALLSSGAHVPERRPAVPPAKAWRHPADCLGAVAFGTVHFRGYALVGAVRSSRTLRTREPLTGGSQGRSDRRAPKLVRHTLRIPRSRDRKTSQSTRPVRRVARDTPHVRKVDPDTARSLVT